MSLPAPYYSDESCTIYNADCAELLPELGRFDLLLTDPPYLLPGMKGAGCFRDRKALRDTQGFTDMGFDTSLLDSFENWFCFCARNNLCDVIGRAKSAKWNILQWCKPNPIPTCNNTYLSDVEYCVHKWQSGRLFGDMSIKSLYEVRPVGQKETCHPNEKPIGLVRRLVNLGTQPGDSIIDNFMGSGTTLVAAKLEGRKAVGIEISEKYCEIAVNRLRQRVLNFEDPSRDDLATTAQQIALGIGGGE